jgi:DNA-directed RNA polymerase subunit A"
MYEPGESVGVIASQSVGQPATQKTLSSFHYVGTGTKSVEGTLGEIINLSIKGEDSFCEIHMKKPTDPSKFLYTTIKEVVKYYYVEEDLDSWWYSIAENNSLYRKPSVEKEKIVFRIVFDKQKLYLRKLSLLTLSNKIKSTITYDKITVMISPEHVGIIDIANLEGYKRKNIRLELFQIVKEIIFPIVINPIKIYNADVNRLVVNTTGASFKDVLSLDFVDYTKTTSNSITDIFKTLGIEAARKAIVIELSKTLNGYVTFSNKHINLIADFMTHKGKLVPINSAGVSQQSESWLVKISYERTMKEIVNASCSGGKDILRSISASIIVGSRANIGTGSMDIIPIQSSSSEDEDEGH